MYVLHSRKDESHVRESRLKISSLYQRVKPVKDYVLYNFVLRMRAADLYCTVPTCGYLVHVGTVQYCTIASFSSSKQTTVAAKLCESNFFTDPTKVGNTSPKVRGAHRSIQVFSICIACSISYIHEHTATVLVDMTK